MWNSVFLCSSSNCPSSNWLNWPSILSKFVRKAAPNSRKFFSVASAVPLKAKIAVSVSADSWLIFSLFSPSYWCKLSIVLAVWSFNIPKLTIICNPFLLLLDRRNCSTRKHWGQGLGPPWPDSFGIIHHCSCKVEYVFPHGVGYLRLVVYNINHISLCTYLSSCQFVFSAHPRDILPPVILRNVITVSPSCVLVAKAIPDRVHIKPVPFENSCVLASSRVDFSGNGIKTQTRMLAVDRATGVSGVKITPLELLSPSISPPKASKKGRSWVEIFIFL